MSITMVSVFELGWRWESVGHNYSFVDTTPAIAGSSKLLVSE